MIRIIAGSFILISLYPTQGIVGFNYEKTERTADTEIYYLRSAARNQPFPNTNTRYCFSSVRPELIHPFHRFFDGTLFTDLSPQNSA